MRIRDIVNNLLTSNLYHFDTIFYLLFAHIVYFDINFINYKYLFWYNHGYPSHMKHHIFFFIEIFISSVQDIAEARTILFSLTCVTIVYFMMHTMFFLYVQFLILIYHYIASFYGFNLPI